MHWFLHFIRITLGFYNSLEFTGLHIYSHFIIAKGDSIELAEEKDAWSKVWRKPCRSL